MARSFIGRLVQPFRKMPRGEPLTNIDATDFAHPENISRIRDAQRREGLPVAQRTDQGPLADPLWITRTQSSPSHPDERPWVRGYRWWVPDVEYVTWFEVATYRIDFLWSDHRHAYHRIPAAVWEDFRTYIGGGGSPGVWFHENVLVHGWRRGKGARYPNFEI